MLLVRDHTHRTTGLHNNHKIIITKHRRLCSLFLKFHWLLPNPNPSLSPVFTAPSLFPFAFPCPPNSALSSSLRSKFSYSLMQNTSASLLISFFGLLQQSDYTCVLLHTFPKLFPPEKFWHQLLS